MSDNKKPRFHLTIVDNETGDTLVDAHTAAIIGAHDAGDEGTACMTFLHCSTIELAATVAFARKVVKRVLDDSPVAKALVDKAAAKGLFNEEE